MSHETKAGLVVSCAFVCMVGAVVYLRMNDGGAPAATEAGELPPWPKTQPAPSPAEQQSKNNSVKAGPQPGAVAPVAEPPRFEKPREIELIGASTPAPALSDSQPKTSPTGGSPLGGSPLASHDPPAIPDTKVASGPPVGDLKVGSDPKLESDAKLSGEPKLSQDEKLNEKLSGEAKLHDGPGIGGEKTNGPLTIEAPAVGEAKTAGEPRTAEPRIGSDTKTASGPESHDPPIGSPFAHPSDPPSPDARMENQPMPPTPAAEPVPPAFTPGANAGSPPGSPLSGPHEPPPAPPNEPKPAGGLVMPPPEPPHVPPVENATPASGGGAGGVNLGPPETRAVPPTPGSNPIGGPPPDPRFAPPSMGSPVADRGAAPSPGVGGANPGSPPVPLASPPTVASPPIPIGGPSAGAGAAAVVVRPPVFVDPRVESFDEETYVCKPSDNFQSISKDKYMTDKYANALLMFNRAHPLAADGIRNEPPVLKSGQPIYLPPLEILEKRYASLIPDLAPRTAPLAGVAPPAVPARTPSPVALSYTVREQPETFYEIAQKQFGRAERWGAIWELNRGQFPNPNQPLPVGTVVRLPGQ